MTPPLRLVTDLTPAQWVQDALPDFARKLVGSILPGGFDAYVRILHTPSEGGSTWRAVAEANGRELRALSQWEDIAPSAPTSMEGALRPGHLAALVPRLRAATSTPEHCWFAVWHGFGDLYSPQHGPVAMISRDGDAPPEPGWTAPRFDLSRAPTFATPQREYYLLTGPVEAVGDVKDACSWRPAGSVLADTLTPNLWWPNDHAWFVATEIDLPSTYVGGSEQLVQSIVDSSDLEAFRVDAEGGYA